MGSETQDAIKQLRTLIEEAFDDKQLAIAFKNVHQGYPDEALERFLKAREHNVPKAYKMLLDCLHWRVHNDIDIILSVSEEGAARLQREEGAGQKEQGNVSLNSKKRRQ